MSLTILGYKYATCQIQLRFAEKNAARNNEQRNKFGFIDWHVLWKYKNDQVKQSISYPENDCCYFTAALCKLCDVLFLYYRLMSPVSCAPLELMLCLLKSMKN